MKILCRNTIIPLLCLFSAGSLYAQTNGPDAHPGQQHTRSNAYTHLLDAFHSPPSKAKPKIYWWWLNGHVNKDRLLEELAAIKAAGIDGVDIFDIGARAPNNPHHMIPGGPAFMGPESIATIAAVIKRAAELNMEVDLSLSSSWNAGGSWIKPEFAGKSLYASTIKISGGGTRKVTLPFPEIPPKDEKGKPRVIVYDQKGRPVYRREVAVLAIPEGRQEGSKDTSMIINISRFFDSAHDELNWQAPEGNWEIQRYVCSNSGEQLKYSSDSSAGPIIDHFDSSAIREHMMYFIDHLKPLLGDLSKTALKSFYLASFEATGSVWTGSLPAEFRKINGYDIYKYLPALADPHFFDSLTTEKFRHDFALVISELMIRNHYGKGKEIANSYGLQLISESGGPGPPLHNVPVESLSALGALDVPRGEFWNKHAVYDKDSIDLLMLVKEISAAAHMYHRDIVELESFTSFQNWNEAPSDLKPLADRAFCEGMSRVVIHGFSHNPPEYGYPGIVYHAGTHYNSKNVWWPMIRPFNEYLSRISSVMQQTSFSADVLYYYGDNVPNFVTPKNTRFSVAPGYDYDIINTDVLLRELSVKNGSLVLPGGATFSVLVLGNMEAANPAVIQKLQQLAEAGAIITGQPPSQTNGLFNQPMADENIRQSVAKLWINADASLNKAALRKGRIISGISPKKIVDLLEVRPDFEYDHPESGALDFIHQQRGDVDCYLVRNTTNKEITRLCRFRVINKTPEIWDPVSGIVSTVNRYQQEGQQIKIPVTLAPYQSYFFVFSTQLTKAHFISGNQPAKAHLTDRTDVARQSPRVEYTMEGPWTISFPKNTGAPDNAVFPSLISWTASPDPGIKYFSGIAQYHKTFQYKRNTGQYKRDAGQYKNDAGTKKNERTWLDLGYLSKIAEVWLNGRSLGITWCSPYRFDITGLLKKGDNELRVSVANVWSNRITGDAITGEKYTETNLPTGSNGIPWASTPLVISGLLGPVTIQQETSVQ